MARPSTLATRVVLGTAWVAFGALAFLLDRLAERFELAALGVLASLAIACWALLGFAVLVRLAWRRLLWSVGRRLAFSYVLVGVLPLLLIASLALVTAYLLGGFLLGHLARDAVAELRGELRSAALGRLADEPAAADREISGGILRFADYRRGRRVEGDSGAPEAWPGWLGVDSPPAAEGDPGELPGPFLALADGRLTLAAVAGDDRRGALVWFDGDLPAALRERTRTWFELYRSDDPRKLSLTRIQIGGRALLLRGLWQDRDPGETAEFYRLNPPRDEGEPGWLEQPLVVWMEQTGAVRSLAAGDEVTEGVSISLAASPSGLFDSLLSTSEQANSIAWLALVGISVLLLEIWAVAAAVALFMIFGLSRAVNRLSRATAALGAGDFSVRIPARRKDQIGDLQRSFNSMSEHLSELIETAAQKEAIDKELELARRVQEDLLPVEISRRSGIDIATFFEPSSAIGGDYFDILDRPDGGLALVIADVAGHGLAAGLRMAMVKSALELMVADGLPAEQVLARLHGLVRKRGRDRAFVTLTFADLDPSSGRILLTNAGHPPCYVTRASGEVEEVAVPGLPLGGLDGRPGRGEIRLGAGDTVLFLSDGIFECRDGAGEPFGFERLRSALSGPAECAAEVLARLLSAVRGHCGGQAVEDDRTVVAVTYRPDPEDAEEPSHEETRRT